MREGTKSGVVRLERMKRGSSIKGPDDIASASGRRDFFFLDFCAKTRHASDKAGLPAKPLDEDPGISSRVIEFHIYDICVYFQQKNLRREVCRMKFM